MTKYQVATTDEIPVGERKIVTVAGRSIGVFNVAGTYFALRNTCPHQGGPLCDGPITGFLTARVPGEYSYTRRGEILKCPWHGWEFDIKTGQSWVDPEKTRVRTYPVTVEEAGDAPDLVDPESGRVPGPYTAERYPVSVEQQGIFVEIV